jgi:hypothetical protein
MCENHITTNQQISDQILAIHELVRGLYDRMRVLELIGLVWVWGDGSNTSADHVTDFDEPRVHVLDTAIRILSVLVK